MQCTIVKNTEKRLHRVHFISDKGAVKTLKLLPGVNVVPKKDWDAAAKNPALKHDLDGGNLVVQSEAKIDDKNGIAGVDPKEARELVAGCFDEKTLVAWLETEKRPGMKFVLEDQLRKVMLKAEEKAEKKKGE